MVSVWASANRMFPYLYVQTVANFFMTGVTTRVGGSWTESLKRISMEVKVRYTRVRIHLCVGSSWKGEPYSV